MSSLLLEIRASLLDTGLAFVMLAALFVPLERSFAARRQSHLRPEVGVDLAFFAFQNLLMLSVLLSFNAWLQAIVGPLAPRALTQALDTLPFLLQVAFAVFAGDILLYWGHRACHRFPILWRFHAVHHSAKTIDWIAAHREHPLDGLFSQLCLNLPAFFLGVGIHAVVPLFVLRGVFATFVHSNVRMPLGPIGFLLGDPVLHRWHHAQVDRCEHNFANVAPYLDVLFGTHHRPPDESFALGLREPFPSGFAEQIAHPFFPAHNVPARAVTRNEAT